jgi:DNA polymerase-3 subunit delta'
MNIIWHKRFAKSWTDRVRQGRVPHAVLLSGPSGVGKRAAAAWIAAERLGIDSAHALPQYPVERPVHADLYWIQPEDGKQGILIDQIRDLVAELQLTSYEGRGKVAVIDPANSMNRSAANSLLKTLEEPPGKALLILIAERTGRLPATVFSRCQRINFAAPAESEGLAWLSSLQPSGRWGEALRMAGNAPLAAIAAAEQIDVSQTMSGELSAVASGEASPIEVASRWKEMQAEFVFDWLARQLRQALLGLAGGRDRAPGLSIDESVLKRMDRRNMFCYLDRINRLRSQPKGSYRLQYVLEELLIDWAAGLADSGANGETGDTMLMSAEGYMR